MDLASIDSTAVLAIFVDALVAFLKGLNWAYIITVMLVAHISIRNSILNKFKEKWLAKKLLSVPTAWRVVVLGIVIGILYAWLGESYGRQYVRQLMESLVAAMIFHRLFLKALVKRAERLFNPNSK